MAEASRGEAAEPGGPGQAGTPAAGPEAPRLRTPGPYLLFWHCMLCPRCSTSCWLKRRPLRRNEYHVCSKAENEVRARPGHP